ncbi:MAG: histidine kinase [Saprospiraceae bacterium]
MSHWIGYVQVLCFLLLSQVAMGQAGGVRSVGPSSDSTGLERARTRRQSSPEEAIQLVKSSLQKSLLSANTTQTAEEYTFLGKLYEDIGQHALALSRYEQALAMWTSLKRPRKRAETLSLIGRMQLTLGNGFDALNTYRTCLLIDQLGDTLTLDCQEGLADAQRIIGRFAESDTLYRALNSTFETQQDSLGLSRIFAKQSQNYLQNGNDRLNANISYQNSIVSLPKEVKDIESYNPVVAANSALVETAPNYEELVELSSNTIAELQTRKLPSGVTLQEQMRLAELSLARGKIAEAVEALSAPEFVVTDPKIRADLYKLQSSISFRQNNFSAAAEAYDRYVAANEEVLEQQGQALAQQATILREQGEVDLLMKDYLLQASEQNLLKNQVRNQWIFIGLLGALLSAVAIGLWNVRKQSIGRQRANQLLQLKSLRAQMNPHFIFNALTSINNFIAKQDDRSANKYLSDFSRLMRMVLQNSEKEFVSLEEEVELLSLYLKLEHARFGDQFNYSIDVSDGLELTEVRIPPMLLQPFVENAV